MSGGDSYKNRRPNTGASGVSIEINSAASPVGIRFIPFASVTYAIAKVSPNTAIIKKSENYIANGLLWNIATGNRINDESIIGLAAGVAG